MANRSNLAPFSKEILSQKQIRDTLLITTTVLECVAGYKDVIILVDSALDQPIGVRLIGSNSSLVTGYSIAGESEFCDTAGKLWVQVPADSKLPWVGLELQAATNPTTGTVTVTVYRK